MKLSEKIDNLMLRTPQLHTELEDFRYQAEALERMVEELTLNSAALHTDLVNMAERLATLLAENARMREALKVCKEKLLEARAEFDCNPNYFDTALNLAEQALSAEKEAEHGKGG